MSKDMNLPQDFHFKKKFGQNFLKDTNLLRAIVVDAGVEEWDNVLEIGAGAGALTKEICAKATKGKVVAVEIDNTLRDFLTKKFEATTNLDFLFGDILRLEPKEIISKFGSQPFRVVANLPYYISSPIIFYLIESDFPIKSITVMLQKELVDRITATPGTKDYGALTVILSLYGKVQKARDVPRTMFTPAPNVDSAILRIDLTPTDLPVAKICKVVKACFAMRRKTLVNNITSNLGLTRDEANSVLNSISIPLDIRAEKLTREQYVDLTRALEPWL